VEPARHAVEARRSLDDHTGSYGSMSAAWPSSGVLRGSLRRCWRC
jgi:hypothetical protein